MITSALDTQALVEKYKACIDKDSYTAKELAEKVLANCATIAANSASKFRGTYEDQSEVEHVARIAVFDALVLYNSDKKTKFETYVRHFIGGRIRNFLRDHKRTIRYPAWYKDFTTRKEIVMGNLTAKLERHPQPSEVAAAMHLTLARYQQILDASMKFGVVSLSLDQSSGVGQQGEGADGGTDSGELRTLNFMCGLDGSAFGKDSNDLFEEAMEHRRNGRTVTDFSRIYKLDLLNAHTFVRALDMYLERE